MDDGREGFRTDRLRLGEWIFGAAAVLLLIDLLALPWYGLNRAFAQTSAGFGAATSATGFQAQHLLGSLAIICCLLAIASCLVQAGQRAPALPVCMTVITSLLSLVLSVGLFVRVVVVPPQALLQGARGVSIQHTDVPAVVGLFLAIILFAGTWLSLRSDGVAPGDEPQRIDRLTLAQRPT